MRKSTSREGRQDRSQASEARQSPSVGAESAVLVKLTGQESYDTKATHLLEKRPTKPLDKIGQVELRITLLQMRRESSIKRLVLLSIDTRCPVRPPACRARCIFGTAHAARERLASICLAMYALIEVTTIFRDLPAL
jgi:hypothetical protein